VGLGAHIAVDLVLPGPMGFDWVGLAGVGVGFLDLDLVCEV
jgi:hypothetical protein